MCTVIHKINFKYFLFLFNYYFCFCFFVPLSLIFFDSYKYFIYFLNDLLINLFIMFIVFLYFYFCTLRVVFLTNLYFAYMYIYLYKNVFFFFKYILLIKSAVFPTTLLNGLIWIHPPLLYLAFFLLLGLIYQLKYFNFFFLKKIQIFFLFLIAFLLGGLWSTFLFTWGFYWVYDVIEFLPLLLLFSLLFILHFYTPLTFFSVHFFYIFIFIYLLLFLRYGFLATRHSFFSQNKEFLFIILFIFQTVISVIFFFKFFFYKNLLSFFFYNIFILFIYFNLSKNYFIFICLNFILFFFIIKPTYFSWNSFFLHICFLFIYWFVIIFFSNYYFITLINNFFDYDLTLTNVYVNFYNVTYNYFGLFKGKIIDLNLLIFFPKPFFFFKFIHLFDLNFYQIFLDPFFFYLIFWAFFSIFDTNKKNYVF